MTYRALQIFVFDNFICRISNKILFHDKLLNEGILTDLERNECCHLTPIFAFLYLIYHRNYACSVNLTVVS